MRGRVSNRRAAAVLAAASALAAAVTGSALATTGPDPYAIVNVRVTDQRITLSKASVHDVTYVDFLVRNAGKVPHNFRIGGQASKPVKAGQTVHLVVAFPLYGKYRYSCSLKCTSRMSGSFQVDRPLPPG